MTTGTIDTSSRTPLAAGLDAAAVTLFVALGRRTHDEDAGLRGVVETGAPFLIALAVAWLVVRAWRRPFDLAPGAAIWAITLVGGMVLRRTVFDRGTATSFVIVASAFLALTLLGWRLAARVVAARRSATT